MANRLLPPVLTRRRIWLGCAVAIAADGLQLLLGPLGWAGADEVIDVIAMCILTATVGFHPLFLPTFVVKFIPVINMPPTWTACTLLVIGLRRRKSAVPPAPPPPPQSSGPQASGPVIDV